MVISDAAIQKSIAPTHEHVDLEGARVHKVLPYFSVREHFHPITLPVCKSNTCSPDGWPCELASYFLHRMARANF